MILAMLIALLLVAFASGALLGWSAHAIWSVSDEEFERQLQSEEEEESNNGR